MIDRYTTEKLAGRQDDRQKEFYCTLHIRVADPDPGVLVGSDFKENYGGIWSGHQTYNLSQMELQNECTDETMYNVYTRIFNILGKK